MILCKEGMVLISKVTNECCYDIFFWPRFTQVIVIVLCWYLVPHYDTTGEWSERAVISEGDETSELRRNQFCNLNLPLASMFWLTVIYIILSVSDCSRAVTMSKQSRKISTSRTSRGCVPHVICMVGMPARGKTYIGTKLARYLKWCGLNTKVFNVGEYRRQATTAYRWHVYLTSKYFYYNCIV